MFNPLICANGHAQAGRGKCQADQAEEGSDARAPGQYFRLQPAIPFHEAINDAPIGALIGAEQTQKGADSVLTDGHQETESYTPASQLPSIVANSAVTIGLTRELYHCDGDSPDSPFP
jgi:hypothetical protein